MQQPEFQERYFDPSAELPYGAGPEDVADAIKEFYTFYSELNEFLLESGFGRMESILRANNALSDFVGNVVTEAVADQSDALIHNQKPDGFPDLLPVNEDEYAEQDHEVHHGDDGIETKCSKSNGGWQAHNDEEAWFIVFRYERGDPDEVIEDMAPIRSHRFSQGTSMKTTGAIPGVVMDHGGPSLRQSSRPECTSFGATRYIKTQTPSRVEVRNWFGTDDNRRGSTLCLPKKIPNT